MMIWSTLLTLVAALVDTAPADPPRVSRGVTIEERMILRVPIRPQAAPLLEWRERRGPRCIAASGLAGAMLSGPDTVDFLFGDRRRFRARLDRDCPTLDFYGGFYLQPADQWICAGRDEIRSRIGGACQIDRFRRLEPRVAR